jgi:hypothetical protein
MSLCVEGSAFPVAIGMARDHVSGTAGNGRGGTKRTLQELLIVTNCNFEGYWQKQAEMGISIGK